MIAYFAYCQGDILLTSEGGIPLGLPPVDFKPWQHVTTLQTSGRECRIYRLDEPVQYVEGLQMVPLRKSFDLLPPEDYRLAGKCAELLYWDQNSRFCGCCGSPMVWQTPMSKHCTGCGKELWPQLSTAIIVRVTRGNEILLVHSRNFRSSYYGLVAGFVETGETLEQCVEREVMEETGLNVCNIRYFASQPWPYPCGLMVGFTAEYAGGEMHLQRSELSCGGWFRRDTLPEIPGRASLARWLIDDWMELQGYKS